MAARPAHLAETVRRKPTHLGFCNAPGLGAGGVWLDPSSSGQDLVWRHPWLEEIIANPISSTNRDGKITNSDMELSVLVLHEATILAAFTEARMDNPRSGSDKTPTIS